MIRYSILKPGVIQASLGLLLLILVPPSQAADITFNATFLAPTCEVSAPASLDFGSILSSEIKQGTSKTLPLDVSLSQCTGFIGLSAKPGIKVTGNGSATGGDFLFRSASSQAVNYGVLIMNSTKSVVQNNTFLPAVFTPENFIDGRSTIPLTAMVSCGNKCFDATTRSGSLNASVTFTFAYE